MCACVHECVGVFVLSCKCAFEPYVRQCVRAHVRSHVRAYIVARVRVCACA